MLQSIGKKRQGSSAPATNRSAGESPSVFSKLPRKGQAAPRYIRTLHVQRSLRLLGTSPQLDHRNSVLPCRFLYWVKRMPHDLWKYCTPTHCREFLLSLRLLEGFGMPAGKQLACLFALSNHP